MGPETSPKNGRKLSLIRRAVALTKRSAGAAQVSTGSAVGDWPQTVASLPVSGSLPPAFRLESRRLDVFSRDCRHYVGVSESG